MASSGLREKRGYTSASYEKTLNSVSKDIDCCVKMCQQLCQYRFKELLLLGVRPFDTGAAQYKNWCRA